jgi:hypothetical protein
MRQLLTDDIYTMSRILKKLGLEIDADATDAEIGLDIIKKIAENLHFAQKDVNDFLGDLAGMTGEQFGKLPVKESLEIIKEFRKLDGVSDFFELVGHSMK